MTNWGNFSPVIVSLLEKSGLKYSVNPKVGPRDPSSKYLLIPLTGANPVAEFGISLSFNGEKTCSSSMDIL